jgi:maleate isomerase
MEQTGPARGAAEFTPEYGRAVGVATPQANTTVEPEMQRLLGGASGLTVLTARLASPLKESRARLIDYFDRLEATLGQFDVAPLAAAGFACTGSCYLVGREDEDRRLEAASRAARYPVISSAQAIRAALAALNARRVALLSPYPKWLSEAGQQYWRDQGITLTSVAGLPADLLDTRGIYKLTTARVLEVYAGLDTRGADAVLLSGTGMPTLRAIAALDSTVPVISSNLCLAWQLATAAGGDSALHSWLAPEAPWRKRLA